MNFEVNGKEYDLKFGLKFIRELDKSYTQKVESMEFGVGVETAMTYIQMKNPTVLYELIKASTAHLKSKPSNFHIEQELEERAENEEIDNLYQEFQEAMESSVFLKPKFKQMKEMNEQAEENPIQ